MSEIAIDELAARLDELPVLDVRAREEYDGSSAPPAIRARATSPAPSTSTLDELMLLDERRAARAPRLPSGRRGRRLLPQRLALGRSPSRSCAGSGYDARNYAARGTSGRGASSRRAPRA